MVRQINCPNFYFARKTAKLCKSLQGVTTYFSANCTIEDSKIVNAYLKHIKMEAYNCRTFKTTEEAKTVYEVMIINFYFQLLKISELVF